MGDRKIPNYSIASATHLSRRLFLHPRGPKQQEILYAAERIHPTTPPLPPPPSERWLNGMMVYVLPLPRLNIEQTHLTWRADRCAPAALSTDEFSPSTRVCQSLLAPGQKFHPNRHTGTAADAECSSSSLGKNGIESWGG